MEIPYLELHVSIMKEARWRDPASPDYIHDIEEALPLWIILLEETKMLLENSQATRLFNGAIIRGQQ